MDFIQHTIAWVKGEIFEAKIFGSYGLLLIVSGFIFRKLGAMTISKALFIPLIVVGLFFLITAISGIISNKKRLPEYTEAFQKDKMAFLKSEKARVEGFQYLYKMTKIIASISFTLALVFFIFTQSPMLKAIGIALIIFGITGLVIDYFSKKRADAYYKVILEQV